MPTAPASPLVAVDANVVMDLGEESESVLDALATIRQRLRPPGIVSQATSICREWISPAAISPAIKRLR